MIKKILELFRADNDADENGDSGDTEGVLSIAREIETAIDGMASNIYVEFGQELLGQNITYIVPAVWGAAKGSELTETQKKIYEQIEPGVNEAQKKFRLKGLAPAQDFAIAYLLRSLLISKVVYMIEATKRRQADREDADSQALVTLSEIEPVGRA